MKKIILSLGLLVTIGACSNTENNEVAVAREGSPPKSSCRICMAL